MGFSRNPTGIYFHLGVKNFPTKSSHSHFFPKGNYDFQSNLKGSICQILLIFFFL